MVTEAAKGQSGQFTSFETIECRDAGLAKAHGGQIGSPAAPLSSDARGRVSAQTQYKARTVSPGAIANGSCPPVTTDIQSLATVPSAKENTAKTSTGVGANNITGPVANSFNGQTANTVPPPALQFGYAQAGGPSAPATRAPSVSVRVNDIVGRAEKSIDELALYELNLGYAGASDPVRKALLDDPRAQKIINNAAAYVNVPFAEKPDGKNLRDPIEAAARAIDAINLMAKRHGNLDAAITGALLDQVFKTHEDAFEAVQNGRAGSIAKTNLAKLLDHAASTVQGQKAAARLAEGEPNRLIADLRNSLPRAAKTIFEQLLSNKNFKSLAPETRLALLSQIGHYRDSKRNVQVIKNLELLARKWSDECKKGECPSLDDQQRFAKVIAFTSQYVPKNSNTAGSLSRRILDNTLAFILRRDKYGRYPKVKFDILQVNGRWSDKEGLVLNRNLVTSGNDKLTGNKAIEIATHTLSHEVNHALNKGARPGTYRHFMDEYRGWYVGHIAHLGSRPSQREANILTYFLVSDDRSYQLKKTFNDPNSPEYKKMVAFIAKILELPKNSTIDDINRRLLEPGSASDNKLAPLPESVEGGPNNLDNSIWPSARP